MVNNAFHYRRTTLRGFMVAEAIIGMAVMTIVFGVVVVAVHSQRRFATRMADDREDLRQVRSALLDLQRRRPIAASFAIYPEPTAAPDGWHWVDVRLHKMMLTGLVPITATGGQ